MAKGGPRMIFDLDTGRRERLERHRRAMGLRSLTQALHDLIDRYAMPDKTFTINAAFSPEAALIADEPARGRHTGSTGELPNTGPAGLKPQDHGGETGARAAMSRADHYVSTEARILATAPRERFTGVTASGEPLPQRKPYQKGSKK